MEFNEWFENNYDRLTRDCNMQEVAEEAWDAGQLENCKSNTELLEALIEIRKLVAHHDKADLAIAKALGQQ